MIPSLSVINSKNSGSAQVFHRSSWPPRSDLPENGETKFYLLSCHVGLAFLVMKQSFSDCQQKSLFLQSIISDITE